MGAMRSSGAFAITLGALGGGLLGGVLASYLAAPRAAVPLTNGENAAWRAAFERLEQRVDLLATVPSALALPAVERALATPATRLPAVEVAPREGTAAAGDGSLDPKRLLAEWVASFGGGGSGSDFFRMAVAAYAWVLRADLQRIVADRAAPEALRLQALAMFDGGSFRGDAATIDTLVALLRDGDSEAAELAALGILAKIGDKQTATLIEAVATALDPLAVRAAAWDAIVALSGSGAEAVLLRLLERERDPAAQAALLALFTGADAAATLRALEITSRFADRDPRLQGAGMIGGFREAPFVALTRDWRDRERDDEVRARLEAALGEQETIPGYHPLQATGAPNLDDPSRDDPRAWVSATADGGREWLELTYDPPLRADRVTITQVCAPGAIIEVAVQAGGDWRTVWSGEGSPRELGAFTIDFAASRSAVARVRVVLDTALVPSWNEIDAVELSGPGGAAYATGAAASSRYGAGRSSLRGLSDSFQLDLSKFLEVGEPSFRRK